MIKRQYLIFSFLIFLLLVNICTEPNRIIDKVRYDKIATDGDESTSSITSFSETLNDDILFYPDTFENSSLNFCNDSSSVILGTEYNSYTDTYAIGGQAWKSSGEHMTFEMMFTPMDIGRVDYITVNLYSKYSGLDSVTYCNLSIWTGSAWSEFDSSVSNRLSYAWDNNTVYLSGSWKSTVSLMLDILNDNYFIVYIDYVEVIISYTILADSNHYAESFADVSDWTELTLESRDSFSSNGDSITMEIYGDSDSDWDRYYCTTPSAFDASGYYVELRAKVNTTTGYTYTRLNFDNDDNPGSSPYASLYTNIALTTNWTTYRYYVDSLTSADGGVSTNIETIRFSNLITSGARIKVEVDYFRLSPFNELGWQHDGSTTLGVTDDSSGSDWDIDISTDGDKLTIDANRTATTGDHYAEVFIAWDTTDTIADPERDYYQFLAINYAITIYSGLVDIKMYPEVDSSAPDSADQLTETAVCTAKTERQNMKAYSSSSYHRFHILIRGNNWVGARGVLVIDFIKLYSIANWSVTVSACGTHELLYVDSGALVSEGNFGGSAYLELGDDWNPAINTATYNIWNLTRSGLSTLVSWYVGGWSSWSSESRGSFSSGTLIHQKIQIVSSGILSAIKFISDFTAPDILDKFIDPSDASEDESVTLTAVTYDAVEIYSVTINAVIYPSGFSDIDYSMEETDQAQVFTYTFGTLTAGYYIFKMTASDGANTYSEYLSIRVRVAKIVISPITFFGVGEDFTQMQMSFEINRDCTFTIYEASASYSLASTHTGSVSEGWSNIAWDKISVTDTSANFAIKFINGSLSTWVNGSYSIAQMPFYLSNSFQLEGIESVTVGGYLTKLATYTIYDEYDSTVDTGTIVTNAFSITFDKWAQKDQQSHSFAIKFINGSQIFWYNSSYFSFKEEPFIPIDDNSKWAFQVSTWNLIAIALVILIVTGIFLRDLNAPNWRKT